MLGVRTLLTDDIAPGTPSVVLPILRKIPWLANNISKGRSSVSSLAAVRRTRSARIADIDFTVMGTSAGIAIDFTARFPIVRGKDGVGNRTAESNTSCRDSRSE